MKIDITRAIILGVVVIAAFSLGFMSGSAYVKRKMRRREEEELFSRMEKEAKKPLSEEEVSDISAMMRIYKVKEDDDTKTGEMVKVTQGHPKDA